MKTATLEAPARARGNNVRSGEVRQRGATVPPMFREAVETREAAPPAFEVAAAVRVTFTPEVSALLLRKARECGVTPYQMVNAIIGDHLDDYYGFVRPEDDEDMTPEEEEELGRCFVNAEKTDTKTYTMDEVWKRVNAL
jgi:hypothetical protein